MEDKVEYILLNGFHGNDLNDFTNILNESWGSFFETTPEIFAERLNSGEFFLGAYYRKKPIGLLETISFNLKEPPAEITSDLEKARYICEQIGKMGNYYNVTNGGKLGPRSKNSNTTLYLDLTVEKAHRGDKHDPPISDGIVDASRSFFSGIPDRYIVTYTPAFRPIMNFHLMQGAMDTKVVIKNARPNFAPKGKTEFSDVNCMCYMVPGNPGFIAPKGKTILPKSA